MAAIRTEIFFGRQSVHFRCLQDRVHAHTFVWAVGQGEPSRPEAGNRGNTGNALEVSRIRSAWKGAERGAPTQNIIGRTNQRLHERMTGADLSGRNPVQRRLFKLEFHVQVGCLASEKLETAFYVRTQLLLCHTR